MDLDAYTAAHEADWDRLDHLSKQARLTGAEVDDLVRLYQATATDLSTVRSTVPDARTIMRLSQIIGRARNRLTGSGVPAWRDAALFLTERFPATLYHLRWWIFGAMVGFFAVAISSGWYLTVNDDVLDQVISPAAQTQYVDELFVQYYDPGPGFAGMVWTNNAWLAAQCVALGITGFGPALVLFNNALNVAVVGAVMADAGKLALFLQLLSPHGLLELTAIFVAAAAGTRLFWSWMVPGPRPRIRAIAEAGRALFTTTIGLVLVLGVSGLVEGFVTGSGLPWWVKTTIGVLVWAGFWVYVFTLGRAAARRGQTGDLEPDRAGYAVATAG